MKNLHLLKDFNPKLIGMIEHAAAQHKQLGSIVFKIIEYSGKSVTIQVIQEKNSYGTHHDQKRLIEIVHETFDRFFTDRVMKVHAIPFVEAPPVVVDPKWINAKMLATGTKLKDMAKETGVDYTSMSAFAGGTKPMSQTVKAMFYFYFLTKANKKK